MRTADTVRIEMIHGDALTTAADVLALKYAQAYHGVDRLVASRLTAVQGEALDMAPDRGEFRLVPSRGAVLAKDILFLGVPKLYALATGKSGSSAGTQCPVLPSRPQISGCWR